MFSKGNQLNEILFNQAIEKHIFTPLDVQFAYSISDDKCPIVLMIAALLSAETMAGHVCLALADVDPENCLREGIQS